MINMIISHRKKFAFFRVPRCGSTTSEFMLRISDAFDDDVDIMTNSYGGIKMKNIPPALFDRMVKSKKLLSGGNLKMFERQRQPEDLPKEGDVSGLNIAHMTPAEAIQENLITLEQLREYKCYAFLRNPYDRFVSGFMFTAGPLALPEIMERKALRLEFSIGVIQKYQWKWFFVGDEQVVEPLDFSNYAEELKRIIVESGGYPFTQIPHLNLVANRLNDLTNDDYYTDKSRQLVAQKFKRDIEMWGKYRTIWDSQ